MGGSEFPKFFPVWVKRKDIDKTNIIWFNFLITNLAHLNYAACI